MGGVQPKVLRGRLHSPTSNRTVEDLVELWVDETRQMKMLSLMNHGDASLGLEV